MRHPPRIQQTQSWAVKTMLPTSTVTVRQFCLATPAPPSKADAFPPLQVQSTPLCEAHAALYTTPGDTLGSSLPYPHENLTIKGVPAASFDGGTILEIYTGHTTISIKGTDATLVRLAADSVRLALAAAIPLANQTLSTLSDTTGLPPVLPALRG